MARSRKNHRRTARKHRGAGYLTDQQFFNPNVLPPTSVYSAPSTNATATMTRPILLQTQPTPLLAQGGRRSRKHRGGGTLTDQQMFNPGVLPPSTLFAAPSTAPTATDIRPILQSTAMPQLGGSRNRKQKHRGGFSPSIMGSFTSNAQAAIVPLALYAVYHTLVPKKGTRKSTKKSRRS
jgi:hypothetical protein